MYQILTLEVMCREEADLAGAVEALDSPLRCRGGRFAQDHIELVTWVPILELDHRCSQPLGRLEEKNQGQRRSRFDDAKRTHTL